MEQPDPSALEWGEPDSESERRTWGAGGWSFDATGHGLEFLGFRGTRIATRVFFSVRDLAWGSPRVTLRYTGDLAHARGLQFSGEVAGYPLAITGSASVHADALRLHFAVHASADVEVTRAGPCLLFERSALAPRFGASGPDGAVEVQLADAVVIDRIATRFDALRLSPDALGTRIGFAGELFEMEDQRNWADSTFKAYCPPLADPQPISFRAGQAREYSMTFAADPVATSRIRAAESAPSLPLELVTGAEEHPMPKLGLLHSGGALRADVDDALRDTRPDYLHLLADLGSATWREDLDADLGTAEHLGADAVITVDSRADDESGLLELAAIATGRAGTVLLFDRGGSTTSARLAATTAFAGTAIRVGGGSRSNFASLNAAGSVPSALEVVAVPLAVASHDDDRRALATSPDSFAAIVRDTRRIAGDRELLVGPVSFRPTFDSWGPPHIIRDPRVDWVSTSRRDGTAFAGAWTVAAVGALADCGVPRVTIGSTAFPPLAALTALAALRGTPVRQVSAGRRVRGLRSTGHLVLGIMTDDQARIDYAGRVLALASPRVFSHSLDEPTIS